MLSKLSTFPTFSSLIERMYGFQECWLLTLRGMSLSGKSDLCLLSAGTLLETIKSQHSVSEDFWLVINLCVLFWFCGPCNTSPHKSVHHWLVSSTLFGYLFFVERSLFHFERANPSTCLVYLLWNLLQVEFYSVASWPCSLVQKTWSVKLAEIME